MESLTHTVVTFVITWLLGYGLGKAFPGSFQRFIKICYRFRWVPLVFGILVSGVVAIFCYWFELTQLTVFFSLLFSYGVIVLVTFSLSPEDEWPNDPN